MTQLGNTQTLTRYGNALFPSIPRYQGYVLTSISPQNGHLNIQQDVNVVLHYEPFSSNGLYDTDYALNNFTLQYET